MPKATKRKDGRWQIKVNVGIDPTTNKSNYKTVYGKTKKEVEQQADQLKFSIAAGINVNSKVKFGKYKEEWYKIKCINISDATQSMYLTTLNHLASLDHLNLDEITRQHIQTIINENIAHPRACQKIKICAKQIFELAIIDGWISKNPCNGLVIPKYVASDKRPLNDNENYLSDHAEFTERQQAFVYLIKYFGLRPEEARAIHTKDFDFNKKILVIQRALVFKKNRPILKETKTDAGKRYLPILNNLVPFFKFYISNIGDDYFFRNVKDNQLITGQAYRRFWETIINAMNRYALQENRPPANSDGLTPYVFRHNYCTMLFYAGVPLQEAKRLMGHKSIRITADIYAHLDHEKSDVGNQLNAYIEKQDGVKLVSNALQN
ncbi:hypothetical protein A4S06_05180 [Erysipelotrichaceae bacterium MTC7]|nr:hypothetical protein A4S06_05180 [Erysipelotrichaceae bacterium MTC7]